MNGKNFGEVYLDLTEILSWPWPEDTENHYEERYLG
jgi:hypothetical protein